ncbi:hypothetical protein PG997_008205 [Apiospora hydei]|uniref:Ankyrin repeat protein n=1 Tax=Apiospora hydei TaxID=1337664 RepID=A0ABR1WA83_9PEZI
MCPCGSLSLFRSSSRPNSFKYKLIEDKQQLMREEEIRRIEALYADLPPLPPKVPQPDYLIQGQPAYNQDKGSLAFYLACAAGNLPEVRDYIENAHPSHADRQFGLEKAAHAFQIETVRYPMQERSTRIHTRVFQRYDAAGQASQMILNSKCPNVTKYIFGDQQLRTRRPITRLATTNLFASGCSNAELTRYLDSIFQTDLNKVDGVTQNIFASGSPRLLELLQLFLDNGWHPNQVLGPHQEVALHHVQCVQDINILKLLLDHGADPTIARKGPLTLLLHYFPHLAPVQRKSGDILDMAAKLRLEYGRALHCLIEFDPPTGAAVDPARFEMAEHLLRNGEDIDGYRFMAGAIRRRSSMTIGVSFKATPLSHAKGCQDWDFVEWLLEKGADPQACNGRAFDERDACHYGKPYRMAFEECQARLSDFIQKVKGKTGES